MSIRDTLGDPANGDVLLDALDERFAALWNGTMLHMTSVGGTANVVTATVTPAVGAGGYQNGMVFSITWVAANTVTNVTLNGLPVVNADGSPLVVGALDTDLVSVLVVIDDEFRIVSGTAAGLERTSYYWALTTPGSQTFDFPTDLDDDRIVEVEMWAGGGGGSGVSSGFEGGGGGGAYVRAKFRYADLTSSVTCVVGAGGTVSGDGGNSTFGAFLTAYGGSRGLALNGGGGGGTNAAAVNTSSGAYLGGGNGSDGSAPGGPATGLWGGGGGGAGGIAGGNAVYGGGGGAKTATAGTSKFGGNGGANGVAGSPRGGGGGFGAAGGRGEIRIWIY